MTNAFSWEGDDIDVMLSDSPHTITVGSVTRPCFYDIRSELGEAVGGSAPQVLEIEVATIKTVHFPGIADGTAVTINQTEELTWQQQYTVLRRMPAGAITELLLQRT